jgi:glucokinase
MIDETADGPHSGGDMDNDKRYTIGFDLGGTKMLSVVFDADYKVIAQEKARTPPDGDPAVILEAMDATVRKSLKTAGIAFDRVNCAGIGVPSPVDRAAGIVISTPNMGLFQYPMKKELEAKWGVPVFLENDTNAGTYGEFRRGAGKGKKHMAGIFVGTGIGAGIILDGKLYCGASGYAGEVGHLIIMEGGPLCGCGQYGCLEAFSSRTAMAKDAVALASAGNMPSVFKQAGSDFKLYKSKMFELGLKENDPNVRKIIERSAWHMGVGMANLVNILNPELIVLGGGLVDRIGMPYLETARASMQGHLMAGIAKSVTVVLSELKELAVPLGAACIAREETK